MKELDKAGIVFVLDDDTHVRKGLTALLESAGMQCEAFRSTGEFMRFARPDAPSCLILDVRLPGANGLDFQHELANAQIKIPIVFLSGHGDIAMTVKAMQAGAVGFLTKPVREQDLLDAVHAGLERDRVRRDQARVLLDLRTRYELLTSREREVMAMVTSGLLNKQTAAEIGLSEVTVKVHRHNVMKKLRVKSLPELVRIADMLGLEHKRQV